MSTAFSTIQSAWGGSNPISLSEYYQGGSIIGNGVKGGAIPKTGSFSVSSFAGANTQYNYRRGSYLNEDQGNDGTGHSLDYYNPGDGLCLVFNFGCMSYNFGTDATQLTYATASSNLSSWTDVYQLKLKTIGQEVKPYNTDMKIKSSQNWATYYSGNWIISGTLNSNNTVTLRYNSSAGSGDAGTDYALARQRDSWLAQFGSYTATVSL